MIAFLLALALGWEAVKLPPGSQRQGNAWVVPVNESFTVKAPAGNVTVPEGMQATPAGKLLHLKCLQAGTFTLDGLEVEARKRALTVPSRLSVRVYGDYPWQSALSRHLAGMVEPGCSLDVSGNATIRASGPGFLDTNVTIPVTVQNATRALEPAAQLVLSNCPEKLDGARLLLDRTLAFQGPQRLMVHHRNLPGQPPRLLQVRLANPGAQPLRVLVDLSLLGPSQDEIYVGHLALSRFLDGVKAGSYSGWELILAPGAERVLEEVWIKPGQTVSGYGVLVPLTQGSARLRVTAAGSGEEVPTSEQARVQERTARGLFPAYLESSPTFQAGSRYLFLALGDQPWVTDVENQTASPGNFGVVQKLHLRLSNPLAVAREFRVEASARGGPARAFFRIDGDLQETKLLDAVGFVLRKWVLRPGEERLVELESVAQAGSNYPIQLQVGDFQAPASPGTEREVGPSFPALP